MKLETENRFGTALSESFTCDIRSTNPITRLAASGNDRFFAIFGRVYNIMWDEGTRCGIQNGMNCRADAAKMFGKKRLVFMDEIFCRLNELRGGLFKNMSAEDNRNLSSEMAKQEKIISKTLSKVIEKLGG